MYVRFYRWIKIKSVKMNVNFAFYPLAALQYMITIIHSSAIKAFNCNKMQKKNSNL